MALGFGIGIPFIRRRGDGVDAQAQAHFDRVIADGGLVPSGLSGVNAFFTTIKTIYGTADITTAISVGLDAQVLGYKLGAGAGTTLGQAAQKLYSCSGASGDVVQTTAASQPLLLVHSGANYWFAPQSVTDNCQTPNAAANQITGDIEIIVNFSLNSINFNNFCTKWSGGSNIQYHFRTTSASTLQFRFSTNGSTIQTISSTANITTSVNWVKVERNATNGEVKFYTSTNGAIWTQLGATVTGVSGNMFNGTSPLVIGQNAFNGADGFGGKIFRCTISNSIGGTPVVDFNPNSYNPANSQTQWTSSTGEIWSIQTGASTTAYKGQIVTKTTIQGDGIDDFLANTTLTRGASITEYFAWSKMSNKANSERNKLICAYADNRKKSIDLTAVTTDLNLIVDSIPTQQILGTGLSQFQRIQLTTAIFSNGVNATSLQLNNGTAQTLTATLNTADTGFILMARATGEQNSNLILNTYISATSADNSTNRTSMYNYIRSINGNSF